MPTIDELVDEIVKQYKQDAKVFKNNNFYLNNTIDIVFDRHDVEYNYFELWDEVFKKSYKKLGDKAKIYVEK